MADEPVGALLRAARIARDLTLEELAERSGLTDRAIGDIERGHRAAPRLHSLNALADALGLEEEERDRVLAAARGARSARLGGQRAGFLLHRLPDFVGREEEKRGIRTLITAGTTGGLSVVVISGPPGAGKTTLAAEVLHTERAQVDRLYADLRGLDPAPIAPEGVLRQLLEQLPGAPQPVSSLQGLSEQWRLATEGRRVLVMLDNAATEAQVRPVLLGTGGGTVLVTSRRRLAGLEGAKHLDLGPLSTAESTRLLASLIPGTASPQQLADLAELCEHIPLALRVAGSRLASNPGWLIADFLGELRSEERRLRALVAGDLGVESAFRISYEHVSPRAREVFRALSLISDVTWPEVLPAAILGAAEAGIVQALDELVELGLVQQIAPARYRLHDLMRLFSRGRMLDELRDDEIRVMEERLRDWVGTATLAAGSWFESTRPSAGGPVGLTGEAQARDWLKTEVGSWVPALRQLAAAGDHRGVIRVVDGLRWFSHYWVQAGVWREVYGLAATASVALDDAREEATHLGWRAWAEEVEGRDPAAAIVTATTALRRAREAADDVLIAWNLQYLARARYAAGEHVAAIEAAEQAAAIFATTSDREGRPGALGHAALAKIELGRLDEAEADLRAVLELIRDPVTAPPEPIARLTEMNAQLRLSRVLLARAEPHAALELAEEGQRGAEAFGVLRGVAQGLQVRGEAHLLLGEPGLAEALLRSARDRSADAGDRDGVAAAERYLELARMEPDTG